MSAKSFKATLEPGDPRLKWIIVRIPFDVAKVWGTRGRLHVRGTINGFPFRTSLFPIRGGGHMFPVNKSMQTGAKASLGSVARFSLEPDTEERIVTMPVELEEALAEDRALRGWFDELSYSIRKEVTDRISKLKSAAARERHAAQTAERLLAAMEAEHDLPPILRAAFARDPLAAEGWKKMSPLCRRMNLLAIFHYQSPQARARRVAKVVQEAVGRCKPS